MNQKTFGDENTATKHNTHTPYLDSSSTTMIVIDEKWETTKTFLDTEAIIIKISWVSTFKIHCPIESLIEEADFFFHTGNEVDVVLFEKAGHPELQDKKRPLDTIFVHV